MASVLAPAAKAQLWTWTKDQMVEYTKAWTGDRFPDGRPKVPDDGWNGPRTCPRKRSPFPAAGRGGGGYSQYEGDWRVLHPEHEDDGPGLHHGLLCPRAPIWTRSVIGKARDKGVTSLNNQYAFDMLQPGDVLVVDLYGKKEGGTIVGDNLFYYIMKATKGGGLVVDGSFRDLDGIQDMMMPCYYRSVHPSAIGGATLSAINVPIRIGNVTVMPGDLVVGDKEGVSFIPAQNAEAILDRADETHVHDEWTRKKFDEGKYKSSDIYSSPRDPALKQEYQEYLKKRLEEIRASRKK